MYAYLPLLLLTFYGALEAKSIDKMIMDAAPRSSHLDMFHMSPDGKVMVTMELDIRMGIKEYMAYKEKNKEVRQKRKAVRDTGTRWENCYVFIEINRNDFDDRDVGVILEAVGEWEKYTCLQFKNATADNNDKIVIQRGDGGCYSRLGRVGGAQEIGLARGCVHKGVVVHEIGHAIGWIHEQARPDRDQFIRVNFNRIPDTWHPQFDKFPERLINDYQVPYDYRSIMHYSGNAVVPRAIETLDPAFQEVIGQREGLSFRDIKLANIMYGCETMECGGFSNDCSRFGTDSFRFKLDGICTCVCPSESDTELLKECDPSQAISTTTTSTTATTATSPSITSVVTSTATPEPEECMDLRDDCAELAENGECKMDMARMDMFCKKSCDFCGKEKMMCMDYDPSCPLLALGNFCNNTAFEDLMSMKCKKSCGLCTPVDPCVMQLQLGLDLPAQLSSSGGLYPAVTCTALSGLLILFWTIILP